MRTRAKTILRWSHYLFFVLGSSAIGYYAMIAAAATYYQVQSRGRLHAVAKRRVEPNISSKDRWLSPGGPLRVGSGMALLGRLEVPRIGLSAMVADGTSSSVLRLAVGHVAGTAMPWLPGNVALAAHRDTFFRRLGDLHRGDVIELTVPGSQYRYKIVFTGVVNPKETWVLEPTTGQTLTLITCYPFHFVGAAPSRFVIRARRSDTE